MKNALFSILFALSANVQAAKLPDPTGPVVLTITGRIAQQNAPGEARFDMAMLESIGGTRLDTGSPWDDGLQSFEGVRLQALLKTVGAEGDVINAAALNDYSSEIPQSMIDQYDPVIAYRKNGRYLSIRERGPLMIMFDYDQLKLYQNENVQHGSVWQLYKLEIQ